jgi:hypothetical protein
MPAGVLLTEPLPVPDFVKFRLKVGVEIVAHDSLEGLETPLELKDLTR